MLMPFFVYHFLGGLQSLEDRYSQSLYFLNKNNVVIVDERWGKWYAI